MVKNIDLQTKNEITWCPGCTNFLFLATVKKAITELIAEKRITKEKLVSVGDIGCAAKMFDYLNISGIQGLHGRTVPISLGIKIGNPSLKVMGFMGDGGAYDEGLEHLIHNCRYNSDFTTFVLNNQIFALTVGQATVVTEEGFKEKTTPEGVKEHPLNPLALALESGATFVARLNVYDMEKSKEIIKKAIMHKGFSFVEIMQPCIKFHDFTRIIKENSYYVSCKNREEALIEARKWNYGIGKIPVGIFISEDRDTFEDKRKILKNLEKDSLGFKDSTQIRKII